MKYISLPLSNARKVTSMYKNCIFFNSLSSSLLQKRSVTLDTFARSDSELWIDSLPRLLYNLIMTYNDTVTCNSVIANGSINFTYDCWEMFRLATSRLLGERSEPILAAKRPTASDEVARGPSSRSIWNPTKEFCESLTRHEPMRRRELLNHKFLLAVVYCNVSR